MRDLGAIVETSNRTYGSDHAGDLGARIFGQCNDVAAGLDHGHVRPDIPRKRLTRYVVVHPFVIAYSPKSRLVVKIFDGRRDPTKIFR